MTQLITPISNHPVLNKTRAIKLKQISYIDFDIKEAQVIWEELFTDEEGNPIIDKTVAKRKIVSHISNSNLVYVATDPQDPIPTGIVIDSENFPQLEEESTEEYEQRMQIIKEKSHPEFDFYVSNILNMASIGQAILLLDHLKRFNRE